MASLKDILKDNFPWLGTDEPAEGSEVIAKLSQLYESEDIEVAEDDHDPRNDRDDEDDDEPTIPLPFYRLAIGDRFIADGMYYTKASSVTAQLEDTPMIHSFSFEIVRKIVGKA